MTRTTADPFFTRTKLLKIRPFRVFLGLDTEGVVPIVDIYDWTGPTPDERLTRLFIPNPGPARIGRSDRLFIRNPELLCEPYVESGFRVTAAEPAQGKIVASHTKGRVAPGTLARRTNVVGSPGPGDRSSRISSGILNMSTALLVV